MVKMVNRAKMSTPTTGTGTLTLGSAITGYQTFSASGVANADVVRYTIEDGAAWEIGLGTYTASGTLLSRTLEESSTGSLLNLSGNAEIFVTAAAEDLQSDTANTASTLVARDASGNFSAGTVTADGLVVNGAAVFNEGGGDNDFRVESDTNTHALFLEGSSGNVGIGTSSPLDRLHVYQNAADNVLSTFQNAAINAGNLIKFTQLTSGSVANPIFYVGQGGDNTGDAILSNASNTNMKFSTNNTERMRIDSSGNLLVGTTTNPQTSKLMVSGSTHIKPSANNSLEIFGPNSGTGIRLFARNDAGTLNRLELQGGQVIFPLTTGADGVYFDATSGNFGIGTSSPTYKLNVLSAAGAQNIFQAGQSGVSNGLSITSDGSALTYSFLTGNVGIGTSSPSAKIHTVDLSGTSGNTLPNNASAIFEAAANMGIAVSAPTAAAAGVYFPRATDAYYAGVERSDTNLLLRNNGAERLRIDSSGNVLLGRGANVASGAEATRIQFYNTVSTYDIASIRSLVGAGQVNRGELSFAVNNGAGQQERMRIAYNGNVGIGTSSPNNAKLHIEQSTYGGYNALRLENTNGNTGVLSYVDMQMIAGSSTGQVILRVENSSNSATDSGELAIHTTSGGTTSEAMRIDSSGNVGINNTSPYSPLSVTTTGTLPQDQFWYDQVNMLTLNGTRPRAGLSTAATAGGNAYDGDMLFYNMYYAGGADYQWKERMRITSSGNVGIGVVPEAWNSAFPSVLQVGAAASLTTSGGDNARLFGNVWYDGTNYKRITSGYAHQYEQTGGTHRWYYAGTGAADSNISWSEAMRIDSSGNLLVGKTSDDITLVGCQLQANGAVLATRASATPMSLNRTGTDGYFADFRKNGTIIGSIGSALGDSSVSTLFIADAGNVGIRFDQASTDDIQPCTTTGADRDDAINLGATDNRFKDLYLSGGVYLGGTGAANLLDDYEEGTWTPVLTANTVGDLSVVYATNGQQGYYTKIGRQVNVTVLIATSTFTHTTASGLMKISGLPFTSANFTGLETSSAMSEFAGITKSNYTSFGCYVSYGGTDLFLQASGSGQVYDYINAADMPTGTTKILALTLSYMTT
jgi:hypothetical protein